MPDRKSPSFLREVRFRPYRKGMGPMFTLLMWDENLPSHDGKTRITYQLWQVKTGTPCKALLFEGNDFRCSPLDGIDSDDCVKILMGFLTLRPGDTDREYFQNYTPAQLEYCSQFAESLSLEVYNRFGE